MDKENYKDKLRELKLQIGAEELRKVRAEAGVAEQRLADETRMEHERTASLNYNRIYHFFDPVMPATVEAAIDLLGFWSRREPGCEMTIVFNSPGGSIIHGLALYDFLQELRSKGHKLVTETRGYAASMGGVLLQAGDDRVIGPNAHLLIHEASSIQMGKMGELEDHMEFLKGLQDRILEILAARSTMTKAQVKNKWKRKDWWLSAEEAVELGFADRIG